MKDVQNDPEPTLEAEAGVARHIELLGSKMQEEIIPKALQIDQVKEIMAIGRQASRQEMPQPLMYDY